MMRAILFADDDTIVNGVNGKWVRRIVEQQLTGRQVIQLQPVYVRLPLAQYSSTSDGIGGGGNTDFINQIGFGLKNSVYTSLNTMFFGRITVKPSGYGQPNNFKMLFQDPILNVGTGSNLSPTPNALITKLYSTSAGEDNNTGDDDQIFFACVNEIINPNLIAYDFIFKGFKVVVR